MRTASGKKEARTKSPGPKKKNGPESPVRRESGVLGRRRVAAAQVAAVDVRLRMLNSRFSTTAQIAVMAMRYG